MTQRTKRDIRAQVTRLSEKLKGFTAVMTTTKSKELRNNRRTMKSKGKIFCDEWNMK
jgi:hypothetical protein